MYKNKKSGFLGVLVTIIVLIIIVIFSNNDSGVSFFENIANKVVSPIQNGLTFIKNKVSGNENFFTNVKDLKEQNEELIKKNSELETSLRELENIKTENEQLKEYLNLTEKYGEYKTISGYVINRDISNYSRTIVINIGSNDGVEKGMTVIGDKGLVGHVVSVTETTAKVQTIIDTSSSVSAIMSTTKDSIVCKGELDSDKTLRAMYIPTDANVIQGDSIETSGIGGLYPKGIHIGTVQKVVSTQNMIDRYAVVETAVNFEKLTSVLVIKNN